MKYRVQTADQLQTCFRRVSGLPMPVEGWLIDVEPFTPPHTDPQRCLLWATWGDIAAHIREQTGQEWTANTVHDLVLGKVYGFKSVQLVYLDQTGEIATIVQNYPLKTMTTKAGKPRRMTRDEMSEVIEATNVFAAEHMVPARMVA